MNNIERRIYLIRDLFEKGYKDKHICMITHAKQPYVSKIHNGIIQSKVFLPEGEELVLTEREIKRKKALDTILTIPEVYSVEDERQQYIYVHVLKFFMVPKKEVYKQYFHWSRNYFHAVWTDKTIDIRDFDSELIGIPIYDYADLIIEFFIK